MSASQRTKGAAGEREAFTFLSGLLSEILGRPVEYKRKLGQAREGGNDGDVEFFVVEVKRRKGIAVMEWLEQAEASIGEHPFEVEMSGKVPMVLMREDHGEWKVLIDARDFFSLATPAIRERTFDREYDRAAMESYGIDPDKHGA